jgi:multiple sugar transport system substrate-binding protein
MYNEMIGDYQKANQLQSFDHYLSKKERHKMLYLPKGRIDGHQYSMPFVVGSTRVLYYNKSILKQAGIAHPPKTWREFKSDLVTVKHKTTKDPFIAPFGTSDSGQMDANFFPFFWQAGGHLFNDDHSHVTFDSQAGIRAAKLLHSLRYKLHVMPKTVNSLNAEDVNSRFAHGKAPFIMSDDSQAPTFTKSHTRWGFVPALAQKTKASFISADGLVVLKNQCEDTKLCTSLVKYMLSGPQMTRFHKYASYPPIAKDESYHGDPRFKRLYSGDHMGVTLHALPIVPKSRSIYNSLWEGLQKMLAANVSPESTMKNAAKDAQQKLPN